MTKSVPTETSEGVLDQVLNNAIEYGASDVHFEPNGEQFKVRFRVDGLLYEISGLSGFSQDAITSRIKVVSELDLFERRLPQDGHFEFVYKDKVYNIRVSTSPTLHGQAVVLRIFNREAFVKEISELGFESVQLDTVKNIVASPYGMVLITGQIGSGKSTLLYSLLNSINSPQKNIITLEDPVEFTVPNIRQLQVNDAVGLTFSLAIRAAVRQDPDVIMLGEIRDSETAQIALQAALTGTLVFSTFHTFDVSGLIIRLMEMGVPRSVLAHALTGVISSRLVRKICVSCAQPYVLSETEAKLLGDEAVHYELKRGQGCELCHGSGYHGRTGIYEVIHFDDEIMAAIVEEKPVAELRELLQSKISLSLRQAAIKKVMDGLTTIDELIRVIGPHF